MATITITDIPENLMQEIVVLAAPLDRSIALTKIQCWREVCSESQAHFIPVAVY